MQSDREEGSVSFWKSLKMKALSQRNRGVGQALVVSRERGRTAEPSRLTIVAFQIPCGFANDRGRLPAFRVQLRQAGLPAIWCKGAGRVVPLPLL